MTETVALKIVQRIAAELSVQPRQVAAAVQLLDEGATVPFIARYRKEVTDNLDDTQLRNLEERLLYLRELEDRRATIIASIDEQGKLTDELRSAIEGADSKQVLEDLYLPYKPKRRTRAQIAREAGLQPLADALLANPLLDPQTEAAAYVDAEKGVADIKAALDGARDILSEQFGETAELLGKLRDYLFNQGVVSSKVVEGKETAEEEKFRDYYDYAETIRTVPSHRALALFRGRNAGVLMVKLGLGEELDAQVPHPGEALIARHFGIANQNRPADKWLSDVCRWCWRVKVQPHIENELLTNLRDEAEHEAIRVFARNLKDLLLAAPAGPKAVIGLDPGMRTGVKVAVVDRTGKVLATDVIYPHEPRRDWDGSIAKLARICAQTQAELISIGNGTASRETDKLASELIARHPEFKLQKIVVSEAGASVYSASELAAKEFPDMDVSLRGAVSIARRLQDPLAELVKIEPKAIGVGQYQHDVNQRELARSLDAVVEDCVNAVGVDANTASVALLARVSGLNATLARNIVDYRDANGPFPSREHLRKVPRLGDKTFEQAAGFLRINNGENPLDRSSVHPEAYPVVERMLAKISKQVGEVLGNREALRGLSPGRIRRRSFRLADRARHSARTRKAGPRPASRVQDRDVPRRRREGQRSDAGHGARRCRDERRGFRRVHRHRRASGWSGARVGDVDEVHQGSSRSRQGRADRQGEGAGSRREAPAYCADHASGRRVRRGGRTQRRRCAAGSWRRGPLGWRWTRRVAAALARTGSRWCNGCRVRKAQAEVSTRSARDSLTR